MSYILLILFIELDFFRICDWCLLLGVVICFCFFFIFGFGDGCGDGFGDFFKLVFCDLFFKLVFCDLLL